MRLYLIRHPRPLAATGLCYGRTDVPVDVGEVERVAAALVAALPMGVPIYSSPLSRCRVLADALAARLVSGDPTFDARLIELDFGDWEGLEWDRVARGEIDAWASDPVGYRPGAGESVREAAARVCSFLHDVEQKDAAVVCHGGTIRLLLASKCGGGVDAIAARAAGGAIPAPDFGALIVLDL